MERSATNQTQRILDVGSATIILDGIRKEIEYSKT
jgi:hypothetical protein